MNTEVKSIALLIESGGPGGAERVVLSLAKEWKQRGFEVVVFTFRTGWLTERLKESNIPHQKIKTKKLDLLLPFRLAKELKQRKVDVLHSHLLDSNFYGAIAAKIAGINHIATEHGDVHHTNKKRYLRFKLRVISLLGSKFVAVSSFTAKKLVALQVPDRLVSVVGNPINLPENIIQKPEARKTIHINESDFVWLHVANLREVKDQPTLFKAFKLCKQNTSFPQRLLLVGDGPEKEKLQSLANELGISEQVVFSGFQDDVSTFYSAADAFVLSSKSEALPMSILEAGSYGLPVVATNVGGISDAIENLECGLLCPPRNPEALGKLMLSVASETELRDKLGRNLRMRIAEKFSTGAVAETYLGLYRQ